jgi:hypothetical protein
VADHPSTQKHRRLRGPTAPTPFVVPPGGTSPAGADVDTVFRGDIIASAWGNAVAADLVEIHELLAGVGSPVLSINGETGAVVLDSDDVGLGNVDNTSDAAKPISDATQAALDLKVPTARTISTTPPLTGGGDLTTNRILAVDPFSSSTPGVAPASGGGSTNFLRADGTWAAPPGGAASALPAGGAIGEVLAKSSPSDYVTAWTPVRRALNPQTGTTYGPTSADENKMVTLSNAAAITVTLPSEATTPVPIGAEIDFAQIGAGQVTFVAGSGATGNGTPGLKLRAQWSAATAKKISTNGWLVMGDLSA